MYAYVEHKHVYSLFSIPVATAHSLQVILSSHERSWLPKDPMFYALSQPSYYPRSCSIDIEFPKQGPWVIRGPRAHHACPILHNPILPNHPIPIFPIILSHAATPPSSTFPCTLEIRWQRMTLPRTDVDCLPAWILALATRTHCFPACLDANTIRRHF